ncbi:MAG: hypothetical protein N2Z21_06340 [Candidatus Sumerlaeaceae bacterium]|nr:hypothetical protein [Candidatus Sumerlaeaceae bacterium]
MMETISLDEVVEWLQEELSRRSYSFVEYITHASPFISKRFAPLWELLLELRKEERGLAETLSRTIVQLGGIPNPQLLDESIADLNYLRLEYLGKLLILHKEAHVGRLAERIAQLGGYPIARTVLLSVWEADKHHIQRLTSTLAACSEEQSASQQPGNTKP